MAKKKVYWEPYVPFMQPNRYGHRNEVKVLCFLSALVIGYGIKKSYFYKPPVLPHLKNQNLYENFLLKKS